jgi:hypothetical protein
MVTISVKLVIIARFAKKIRIVYAVYGKRSLQTLDKEIFVII